MSSFWLSSYLLTKFVMIIRWSTRLNTTFLSVQSGNGVSALWMRQFVLAEPNIRLVLARVSALLDYEFLRGSRMHRLFAERLNEFVVNMSQRAGAVPEMTHITTHALVANELRCRCSYALILVA